MIYSKITGHGHYLPEKIVTNHDLAKTIDTSDEWITEKIGIKQRHIASDKQLCSDLAIEAAKNCFENCDIKPEDIDGVIVATITPDELTPSTATKVQHYFGMKALAFDIQAACSGFVYGVHIADSFVKRGHKNILVIGVDIMSRTVDWKDRDTCVFFADGAGAVIVSEYGLPTAGILASVLHADGSHHDALTIPHGDVMKMDGHKVFEVAPPAQVEVTHRALKMCGRTVEDIDWLVLHQNNKNIIHKTADMLGVDQDKVIMTVDQYGNTSAGSIPLALCHALDKKLIKQDDIVALTAVGAGMTSGSCIIKF